jgi:2-methylisocitrate lyase-like PEP mutase family enzyme
MKKHIFRVEAEGDTVYIEAEDKKAAIARLTEVMGPIPASMLKWGTVDKLPKGEELL